MINREALLPEIHRMDDRRKEARKRTSDYFMVYNAETEELIGRVMDLNVDGVMLISENPNEVPCTLKCRMVLPQMIGRHSHLHFEVTSKWCKKNSRLGWYETGYQVINLSDDDHKLIQELTDEWASKISHVSSPGVS
jgi:hypothetical protein